MKAALIGFVAMDATWVVVNLVYVAGGHWINAIAAVVCAACGVYCYRLWRRLR